MEFVSFEEMKKKEKDTEKSTHELMQHAGKAVAEEAKDHGKVVYVCGPGNNGGDGYSAYSHTKNAKVYPVTEPSSPAARKYSRKVRGKDFVETIERYDCIVDCLLGIGAKGEPREPIKSVVKKINKVNSFILSVDIPSGLGTETEVKSDLTVCLQHPKKGMEEKEFIVKKIW